MDYCESSNHKELRFVKSKSGVDVFRCEICGKTKLFYKSYGVRPSTIRKVLEVVRELPKNSPTASEFSGRYKTTIADRCKERFGMDYNTAVDALEWLSGEEVDGFLRPVKVNGGEVYVRLVNPHTGDPELVSPLFRCQVCGRLWNVDDLINGQQFSCSCGQGYAYGMTIRPLTSIQPQPQPNIGAVRALFLILGGLAILGIGLSGGRSR